MSSICGGIINWSDFKKQKVEDINPMVLIRKRVNVNGKYRYKLIDMLSDCFYWEDER